MHGIEVVDGRAAFAGRRIPAWHALGFTTTEDLSTEEIMQQAYLKDWNVRKRSYKSLMPENWSTHIDKSMIIRDNPFYDAEKAKELGEDYDVKPINLLGDAGEGYEIMQNEELFEFGALFGQRWETAGSIQNGTQVFGSLALETEIVIDAEGANDVVKEYLLLSTSHDGSQSMIVGITPIRVVCQNTLNLALGRGLKSQIKLRHTKTMKERLEKAKQAAQFTVKYLETFSEQATEMFETSVTNDQFWDIVKTIYPEPDSESKAASTRWKTKTDEIMQVWNSNTVENIVNTGWGAFNALSEHHQYFRNIYGGDSGLERFFMAGAGFDDATNVARNKLWEVTKEKVLV